MSNISTYIYDFISNNIYLNFLIIRNIYLIIFHVNGRLTIVNIKNNIYIYIYIYIYTYIFFLIISIINKIILFFVVIAKQENNIKELFAHNSIKWSFSSRNCNIYFIFWLTKSKIITSSAKTSSTYMRYFFTLLPLILTTVVTH